MLEKATINCYNSNNLLSAVIFLYFYKGDVAYEMQNSCIHKSRL